jgi:Helix-turn-helix domain
VPKANYREPVLPPGTTSFKNCSVEVSKLPLDVFLRVGDGRKFLLKCRQRKALLQVLASFASHDGTSCYPSNQTLQERTCLSADSVSNYLRDLESNELRFVIKGGYAWEGGPRTRRLIVPTVDEQDSGIRSGIQVLDEQDSGPTPESTRQSSIDGMKDGDWTRSYYRATGRSLNLPGKVCSQLESKYDVETLRNTVALFLTDPGHYHDSINNPAAVYQKCLPQYLEAAGNPDRVRQARQQEQELIEIYEAALVP